MNACSTQRRSLVLAFASTAHASPALAAHGRGRPRLHRLSTLSTFYFIDFLLYRFSTLSTSCFIDFLLYRLPALSIFYLAGFYFIWTFAWRGKSREDDPTEMVYSPGTSCHAVLASSKMERNSGSIWTVTSLLSPAASLTLRQPIRRLGGSPALAGRAA